MRRRTSIVFAAAIAALAGCSGRQDSQRRSADAEQAPPSSGASEGEAAQTTEPLPRLTVTVYYPAAAGEGLVGEPHEIFETAAPGDRAKQILADLIAGPTGNRAERAMPPGTQLRQVYVLDDGVAYVDFSSELQSGVGGGSLEERLAVYSVVNSVALNVPEIRKVGILVGGEPIETLNGHLDLKRPLSPDKTLILGGNAVRS